MYTHVPYTNSQPVEIGAGDEEILPQISIPVYGYIWVCVYRGVEGECWCWVRHKHRDTDTQIHVHAPSPAAAHHDAVWNGVQFPHVSL